MKFSSDVIRRLRYYVYLYINPLDNTIFYVGKEIGNRVFDHLDDQRDTRKANLIKKIRQSGMEPGIEILVHDIQDEETALRIEAAVIDLLGKGALTNEVRGWHSGLYGRLEVNDLIAMYEKIPVDVSEPAVLIRINQLFRYDMSPMELYDATRGAWKMGKAREKALYAFAVFDGIVREVYEVRQWFPAGTTFSTRAPQGLSSEDQRWEFVGVLAGERIRRKYVLKSVAHYFPKNAQNPFTYVNVDESHE